LHELALCFTEPSAEGDDLRTGRREVERPINVAAFLSTNTPERGGNPDAWRAALYLGRSPSRFNTDVSAGVLTCLNIVSFAAQIC